jgi:hypothetical protein
MWSSFIRVTKLSSHENVFMFESTKIKFTLKLLSVFQLCTVVQLLTHHEKNSPILIPGADQNKSIKKKVFFFFNEGMNTLS